MFMTLNSAKNYLRKYVCGLKPVKKKLQYLSCIVYVLLLFILTFFCTSSACRFIFI